MVRKGKRETETRQKAKVAQTFCPLSKGIFALFSLIKSCTVVYLSLFLRSTVLGPVIDAGSYTAESTDVIRYTPPCPEFEVMVMNIDPGKELRWKNPGVPSILIILEGSGELHGKLCRPGRSYFWPADSEDLYFTVDSSRRGSMKVAIAHKNLHLSKPTMVNREDFGGASSSHRMSVPASPMPYMGRGGTTPVSHTKTIHTEHGVDMPSL